MKIEQSLRQAILEKRFCCAFQTKVDIRTEEIKGIEALVRLRDNEDVIKAPGHFINLAVELGLIDELTHLVLAEITRSIDLINDTFGSEARMSINVAAKQANPEFHALRSRRPAGGDPGFRAARRSRDGYGGCLRHQDLFPGRNPAGLPQARRRHLDRRLRHRLFIPSALADITADEIKIDRSFITDIHKRPRSQGILRAIESLSEALGMTVIAEGIEISEGLAHPAGRNAEDPLCTRLLFLAADLPGGIEVRSAAGQ